MEQHQDLYAIVCRQATLQERLRDLHPLVRQRFPFIDRIAVAIYDPQTDLIRTLAHSSGGDDPLSNYVARLSEAKSLQQMVAQAQPRVVNDLDVFSGGTHEHTQRIRAQGYGASYTMPIFYGGRFAGFVFFDSYRKQVFTEDVLAQLDLIGHLIGYMLVAEESRARTLLASVKSAIEMVHERDFETGLHLQRVANYARLIAQALAPQYHLDDEYIEAVFRFAPLHDVGKIAIPDRVLMKPERLTDAERQEMQQHSARGGEIIDEILRDFGLQGVPHAEALRNIALYHHEKINGSGYPAGLRGADIPLEARIVAVADVFDALTSERVYKKAWNNQDAFNLLERLAGEEFDRDCVAALVSRRPQVEALQARFREQAASPAGSAAPAHLWRIGQLENFWVHATDGVAGVLQSVVVDLRHWQVTDLIVRTGEWTPGPRVRVATSLAAGVDPLGMVNLQLTRDKLERQPEAGQEPAAAEVYRVDSVHLLGSRVRAHEGDIGYISDLVVEDASWSVRYLVLDAHHWVPGKKILLPPRFAILFDAAQKQLHVHLDKPLVRQAPTYYPSLPIDPAYDAAVTAYYAGRQTGRAHQVIPERDY